MVEIYIEPELEEMTHSTSLNDEWKKKVNELGLDGQLKLIEKDGNPSPYTFMNNKMIKVFAVLCPTVVDYKDYCKSTIPIEVLSHIALCEKEKYFNKLKIWYDDMSPDPILVGYIKTDSYRYTQHLIARWGDEILPYEVLEGKAIKRIEGLMKSKFETALKTVENNVFDWFNPTRSSQGVLGLEFDPVNYNHTS